MSKTTYVNCTVSEGMFSTEFYITVKNLSYFIDRVNVQVSELPHNGDEVEGKVIAYVVKEKGDQALIQLPAAEGPQTWVSKTDLVVA